VDPSADLRAARANRAFCMDEKRIDTERTVMNKSNDGVRDLSRGV
jgi:hypothetical protein